MKTKLRLAPFMLLMVFSDAFKKLKDDTHAFIDVGVGIGIGILIAGLMVIAYIIWTLREQLLLADPTTASTAAYNTSYYAQNMSRASIGNLTTLFDNAILLIGIVVVVWLLALAIISLIVLKKKAE